MSQASGLSTTSKRQQVVDENQFEKMITLRKSNNTNQEHVSILEAQLQNSFHNSDDLTICFNNDPEHNATVFNTVLSKNFSARTFVGHNHQSI